MLILAASRYVVDWGRVGIGSPLKAVNNWARRMREKSTCFLSERGNSLVNKLPVVLRSSLAIL
jgi:hypothetical protein